MNIYRGILLFILFIALLVRVWDLGKIPYGLANDEVNYLYSAYHLFKTGEDLHGNFLPLSFQIDSSLSPVPVYLASPFVGLLGPSVASGRIPFILLGVGTVLLVYLLTKVLFKKESIALLAALTIALSPWHILISRGAWDGIAALFFYLFGIYIFVRNIEKGNILWSLPFFLLGFYSYHGTKVFFAALICILYVLYRKSLWENKKRAVLFTLGLLGIFFSFYLVLLKYDVTRQEALSFNNAFYIKNAEEAVNFERTNSIATSETQEIFSNKGWFFLNVMIDQYLGAFSPQYLFTVGDINRVFAWGVFFKGVFYIVDLPFMLFGIWYLFKFKNRREVYLLIAIILIAPLPSTVAAGKTYIIRGLMMLPFFSILIGAGMYGFFESVPKQKYKFLPFLAGLVVACVYALFISRFLYQYFYQFGHYGGEYWNASSRILSEYIGANDQDFERVYVVGAPEIFLIHYGFYNSIEPYEVKKAWNKKGQSKIGKVSFIGSCLNNNKGNPQDFLPNKTLYITHQDCHKNILANKNFYDPIERLQILWKAYEKK
jgi:4-amino-4-deoxy-L-arabinose transferase-like glycosyltransferase